MDPPPSPHANRKKHRRKKSTSNFKVDGFSGNAEGTSGLFIPFQTASLSTSFHTQTIHRVRSLLIYLPICCINTIAVSHTHRRTPKFCVLWRCSGTDVSEQQMCNVFPAVSKDQAADGPPWSERNMLSDYYTLAQTTRLNAVCHSNTRRLHSSLQTGFWHACRYLYLFWYCVACHIPAYNIL